MHVSSILMHWTHRLEPDRCISYSVSPRRLLSSHCASPDRPLLVDFSNFEAEFRYQHWDRLGYLLLIYRLYSGGDPLRKCRQIVQK